jgi:hypothetical protein
MNFLVVNKMGFWKNVKIMLGINADEYINRIPRIEETLILFMNSDIDINEYNLEQYDSLYSLLKDTDAAANCLHAEITAEELEKEAKAKNIVPIHYYMIYIKDETKREAK